MQGMHDDGASVKTTVTEFECTTIITVVAISYDFLQQLQIYRICLREIECSGVISTKSIFALTCLAREFKVGKVERRCSYLSDV